VDNNPGAWTNPQAPPVPLAATPEPTSIALTSTILVAFGLFGRKRIAQRMRQSNVTAA